MRRIRDAFFVRRKSVTPPALSFSIVARRGLSRYRCEIPRGRMRRATRPGGLNMRNFHGLILACLLAALLAGCAKIGVQPYAIDRRLEQISANAVTTGAPSERTMRYLRMHGLSGKWRSDITGTLLALEARYKASPHRDALFALMELCWLGGKMQPKDSQRKAEFYLTCAVHAHDFLFDPDLIPHLTLFDPASRAACEFYNRSLAALVVNIRNRDLRLRKHMRLPLLGGTLELEGRVSELAWRPREFDNYFVAYEFKVKGLDEQYGASGLGVPLIAVRTPKPDERHQISTRYLPRIRQTYAATVYLRIKPGYEKGSTGSRVRKARLELYDPINTTEIRIMGRHVPLETDLTTPLAYMMEVNSPPQGIVGLLKPEEWSDSQGLHMLQPYEPEKIPVVFVHGLMSSPITWLPMLNNLMGDPVLRKRFQFWFFMYPTGNPILYSASLLRDSLKEMQSSFDPDGTNPAFNNMVIIGHSMGGLLTRAMIQESGDVLWKSASDKTVEAFGFTAAERDLFKNVLFFEPLPFVKRVVFLATPHRGSELASGPIGRLGASLVTLPFSLIKGSFGLLGKLGAKEDASAPETTALKKLGRMPTGIDGLKPENPVLKAGAKLPMRAPFHSVIGDNTSADETGGTDGVVPYWSSHMDKAESEIVVLSGHGVQDRPRTVLEVRRILLMHAGEEAK